MRFQVTENGPLQGSIEVAGDKSISHRALILGALAEGDTKISGLLHGEDVLATAAAMQALGARIEGLMAPSCTVHGVGTAGLRAPGNPLDLGNSGTAIRLLCGVVAGQGIGVRLVGDDSLSQRPMQRIIDPLVQMGAGIEAHNGCPPLTVAGGRALCGIDYRSPVASAQVKSCVLLAGLGATGTTRVAEPLPSRDHTERMLPSFGCPVTRDGDWIAVVGGARLTATAVVVPADISSAAFFLVAGSIVPGSEIELKNVGMNALRSGILDVLEAMGADIERSPVRLVGGEPVADLRVRYARLRGIDIPLQWVPRAIDEFPALFIAAACADGRTTIAGAEELRLKESDRIGVMSRALTQLGIRVQERSDGAVIEGGEIQGGVVDAGGDHRCAMSLAIAGSLSRHGVTVQGCHNVATSYPNFAVHARSLGCALRSIEH